MSSSAATATLLLPRDVSIRRVGDVQADVFPGLAADPASFIVVRPGARSGFQLVNADAAEILGLFRQPMTIAEAMVTLGQIRGVDPQELLDRSFRVLSAFVKSALLVPADSPLALPIEPTLRRGARVGSLRVETHVKLAADTEVYRVRDGSDRRCLKIARLPDDDRAADLVSNEAAALRQLEGDAAPRLLDEGIHNGQRFVLMTWHGGETVDVVAGVAMDGRSRRERLRLMVAIASAYARLHERDVFHGDVSPSNVVVDSAGNVVLLDFAFARVRSSTTIVARGVAPGFWDPDMARALLAKQLPPVPDAESDQYAVGALLYYLVSGRHYVDFSLRQPEALQQVLEENPRSFLERGLAPWPELEGCLQRMLAKSPTARFSSLCHAVRALQAAQSRRPVAEPRTGHRRSGAFVNAFLHRMRIESGKARRGLSIPPCAALASGAAGMSLALARIAAAHADPALNGLAEIWATRASEGARRRDAFTRPNASQTPPTRFSLFHGPPGVHFSRACVAHAASDPRGLDRAVEAFVRAAGRSQKQVDVLNGLAGVLVGCAHLCALPRLPEPARNSLTRLGNTLTAKLSRRTNPKSSVMRGSDLPLGMAHGWGGVLYATMRWSRSTGSAAESWVIERLDQLAAAGQRDSRGIRWRWGRGHGPVTDQDFMPGWCGGSGGLVHAWLMAHELIGDTRFLDLAIGAGRAAWSYDTMASELCCGAAGRAYSMLAVWRATKDREWIHRAHRLADRAVERFNSRPRDPALGSPDGLMRGAAGIAVLLAELNAPEWARMPVMEAEPWPIATNYE